jgi:hypothetical protein
MKTLKILSLLVLFTTTKLFSQTSIPNTTTVVENFNLMGSSTTATLPTGFKLGTDWSSGTTATTLAAGTSGTGILTSSSGGGFYNFASGITASSTDRSIGFLSSGSYTSPRSIIYAFTNNTGSTVTSLSLSWNYEKYRSGSRDFNWTFFHGSTSTATTASTSGDQSYVADANNTTISNPPASTAKSFSITGLSISNGSTYYLRWTYTGNGGSTNGQGLGIDDFSIKVTTSAPTATITGAATTSAFTTTYGTTSTPQSFSISGSNLTASITATAPTGFEVSNDGITYGSTATFTQSSGSASGTLRIRLKTNASATGTYNSNNIVLSSTGATSVNITTPSSGNSVSTKSLTVGGISFSDKVYDGTTTVTISGTPSYVGLVNSESFTVSGSVTWAFSSANAGSTISITRTGSYSAPSTNYTVTQPTGFTANITKANQTITYNNLPFKCSSDVDFAPDAVSSVGSVITFTSSNTSIATIVSNKVHIVGNGTCTITASQAGNTNYFAATNVTKTLIVKSPTSRWSFESTTISNTGTTPNFGSTSAVADIGDLITSSSITGFHSSSSTSWTSSFVGNGNSKSISATNWSVNDYIQFQLKTTYYDSLLLTIEQTSSGTGPRDFKLQYSLNGSSYTDITTYQVPYYVPTTTAYAWSSTTYQPQSSFSFDLSSLTQIHNQSLVYFRLVNTSTTALLGGTIQAA